MDSYERNTYQCRIKALREQVRMLLDGTALKKLRKHYESMMAEKDRLIKKQEAELSKAHSQIVSVRKIWSDIMDDLEKEFREKIAGYLKEIKKLKDRILEIERQRDEAKDRLRERTREYYAVAARLEEEKEKNRKLTAQINKDFENSSIPSSMQQNRKKITNSREKSGRKPGGQPGHKGHPRKKHAPTEVHEIPAPDKYTKDPAYRETGKIISRQMIEIAVICKVIEYRTKEYISKTSGHRVHADFPAGYVNDVNYGSSVKAFAFLLNNECNVSHAKTKKLIQEISEKEIDISVGMINNLIEEFAAKSKSERDRIYETLMQRPVMNVDFTNANVNGKSAQVLICAAPDTSALLFIPREVKGHEGIRNTIVDQYNGTLVHDHDTTFYSYGIRHQECYQHNIRYLIGSTQNEPELEWNKKMLELSREMLHYRNELGGDDDPDPGIVSCFEHRYDEILDLAGREYEDEPPGDYYREGYNLYLRLRKYKESELLFLHDKRVPSNNSLCERLARVYKRKQKQAMVLRSYDSFENICHAFSVINTLRPNSENFFNDVAEIFIRERPYPRKKKQKNTEEADPV